MQFSKSEMLHELRTIFLFEADHILIGRGPDAAEAFIGFDVPENDYCLLEPSCVDLGLFPISGSFARGFDFAFTPSLIDGFGEEEVQDLQVFIEGTPRIGGTSGAAGEMHSFMTPDGLCRTVADMVFARWKLEWAQNGTFTTRELALLANMTEGAVRNAMSEKDEGALRAIPKSKPVEIEYEEARRWLSGRRAFHASPERPIEDRVLHERIAAARSASELSNLIRRVLMVRPMNGKGTARWSDEELNPWQSGEFRFDLNEARRLAADLDLDEALFVGKALEVALRRDAATDKNQ